MSLSFARVSLSVLDLWARAGVVDVVGPDGFFPTVRAAVERATATGDSDNGGKP